MNFLLDVNASGPVARWLIEQGHNVAQVSEKDPRMSDDDILAWAVRERRVIVTTDTDFEQMIWRQDKQHCGVLRLENLPRSLRKSLLHDALDHHGSDLESGAIVIALSRKYRVRRKS
jgi:predicted nuclease of predicted toxin-antitoxin system